MKSEWESTTLDELFALRKQAQKALSKAEGQKVELERRLRVLNHLSSGVETPKHRSP
jgi:hypothetical protein